MSKEILELEKLLPRGSDEGPAPEIEKKDLFYLDEKEKDEFDTVTLDVMKQWKSVSKLRRLEAYMRSEGFTTTADVARQTLLELGGTPLNPDDPVNRRRDYEMLTDERKGLSDWLTAMQELEAGLSGRSSIYNAGPAPGPGPRKAGHSASSSSSASENTAPSGQKSDKSEPKSDSKFGGNVRSGSEYYSKWDKYASEAERKLAVQQAEEEQREEKKLKGLIKEDQPATLPPATSAAAAQRVIEANQKLSEAERKVLATREKEKANEYFRAKEFDAALVSYHAAMQLDPSNPVFYSNRAAVYLKLKQWDAAVDDCTRALDMRESARLHAGAEGPAPWLPKALLRRGAALLELSRVEAANEDLERAFQLDAQSKEIQELLEKTRAKVAKKKHRIPIVEVDGPASAETTPCAPTPAALVSEMTTAAAQAAESPAHSSAHAPYAALCAQAAERLAQKRFPEALALLTEAAALRPADPGVYHQRAAARRAAGDLEGSERDAAVSLALCPTHVAARLLRGRVRMDQGFLDLAVADLQAAASVPGSDLAAEVQRELKRAQAAVAARDAAEQKEVDAAVAAAAAAAAAAARKKSSAAPPVMHRSRTGGLMIEEVEDEKESGGASVATAATVLQERHRQGRRAERAHAEAVERSALDAARTAKEQQRALDREAEAQKKKTVAVPAAPTPAASTPAPSAGQKIEALKDEGAALFKAGDFKGAENRFSSALDLDAKHVACLANRSMVRLKLQDNTGALRDAEAVLQLEPRHPKAMHRKALALRALGRLPEALAALEALHAVIPSQPGLKEEVAQVRASVAAATKAAAEKPEREKQSAPTPAPGPVLNTKPVKDEEDNAEAPAPKPARPMKKAADPALSARLKEEGNASFKAGAYDRAVELYTDSLQADPQNVASLSNRALCFLKLERFEEAEEDCTRCLKIDMGNPKALLRRAQARRALGQLRDALIDYQQAFARNPDPAIQEDIKAVRAEMATQEREKDAKLAAMIEEATRAKTAAAEASASTAEAEKQKFKIAIEESDDEEDEEEAAAAARKSTASPAASAAKPPAESTESRAPPASPILPSSAPLTPPKPAAAAAVHEGGTTSASPGVAPTRGPMTKVHQAAAEKAAAALALTRSRSDSLPAADGSIPPPKSALDFERSARKLEGEALASYVAALPPAQYKAVFKDGLSIGCMSALARGFVAMSAECLDQVTEGLTSLTAVPRFDLLIMQVHSGDRAKFKEALDRISNSGKEVDGLAQLRKKYRA